MSAIMPVASHRNEKNDQGTYRVDLEGLRGLALILVLLFHFEIPPFTGGYIGVDIFFVLSGYLISGNTKRSLRKGSFTLSTFYMRRVTRLAPALLVTIFLSTVASVLILPALSARDAVQSAAAATVGGSNILFFFRSGYFDTAASRKPLLHTWSLGIETQFYMFWPLLHSFLFKIHSDLPGPVAALGTVFSIMFTQQAAVRTPNAAFYLPHHRAWEFLAGAVLALRPHEKAWVFMTFFNEFISVSALIALVSASTVFGPKDVFPGFRAIVPCLSTAALIASSGSFISRLFLSSRLLRHLGTVSYSVYLFHWPFLTILRALHSWAPMPPIVRFASLLGAIVGGYALYSLVERPLMARREFGNKRAFFLKFLALSSTIVFVFLSLSVLLEKHANAVRSKALSDLLDMKTPNTSLGRIIPAEAVKLSERSMLDDNVVRTRIGKRGRFITFRHPARIKYSPRVAIIGDSHAAMLGPLAVHMRDTWGAQVEILALWECPPLLGVVKIFLWHREGWDNTCQNFVAMWRNRIVQKPFDAVFLASRWEMHLTNHGYSTSEDDVSSLLVLPNEKRKAAIRRGTLHGKNHSRSLFAPALKETASFIAATGAIPIFFSQPPILPFDPRTCEPGNSCLGVSKEKTTKHFGFIDDSIKKVAEEVAGTKAVILPRYFCESGDRNVTSSTHCRTKIGDAPLYRDDNHLSPLGAAYVSLRWQEEGYGGISWQEITKRRFDKHTQ